MYVERKPPLYIKESCSEFKENIDKLKNGDEALDKLVGFVEPDHLCFSALKEISMKLDILDDNFNHIYKHNPVHHMERRVKEMTSLVKKLQRKGLTIDTETAKINTLNIAGIRVVCNYLEDIYAIEKSLLKQEDAKLLKHKDYIQYPKENGYCSLHIAVSILVFLADRVKVTPVEIQIRTIGMDIWASLEYRIRYKNNANTEDYRDKLKERVVEISDVEAEMQTIHLDI